MKYKLIKDLPNLQAGTVFYFDKGTELWIYIWDGESISKRQRVWEFTSDEIQNPDFFEEYEDPQMVLKFYSNDKAMDRRGSDPYYYGFATTKEIKIDLAEFKVALEALIMSFE